MAKKKLEQTLDLVPVNLDSDERAIINSVVDSDEDERGPSDEELKKLHN